jgi:hypothetical protein
LDELAADHRRLITPPSDGYSHTRYAFPDQATARKFASWFGGESLGEIKT